MMRNRLVPFFASCALILAIMACNLPGGQTGNQPDLVATITAQALALQTQSSGPAPVATPQAADTQPVANPPPPTDTPLPAAPSKPKNFKANGATTSIQFTWNDNSLDETGFRIYQQGPARSGPVQLRSGTGEIP